MAQVYFVHTHVCVCTPAAGVLAGDYLISLFYCKDCMEGFSKDFHCLKNCKFMISIIEMSRVGRCLEGV